MNVFTPFHIYILVKIYKGGINIYITVNANCNINEWYIYSRWDVYKIDLQFTRETTRLTIYIYIIQFA